MEVWSQGFTLWDVDSISEVIYFVWGVPVVTLHCCYSSMPRISSLQFLVHLVMSLSYCVALEFLDMFVRDFLCCLKLFIELWLLGVRFRPCLVVLVDLRCPSIELYSRDLLENYCWIIGPPLAYLGPKPPICTQSLICTSSSI